MSGKAYTQTELYSYYLKLTEMLLKEKCE